MAEYSEREGTRSMTLKKLIKQLKDMETLYQDAVITVTNENGEEYYITSICGFYGEVRPHECPDPHVVNINIKRKGTMYGIS